MNLTISEESPLTEDGHTLIAGSEAALREFYTPEECFSFTAAELARPGTRFFVARRNGAPVGCVALCTCDGYGEVKRLYVGPNARGTGAGRALMAHLESEANAGGISVIRLETGSLLAAGVALYRALGYADRGPFGSYQDHPASLFMEKIL